MMVSCHRVDTGHRVLKIRSHVWWLQPDTYACVYIVYYSTVYKTNMAGYHCSFPWYDALLNGLHKFQLVYRCIWLLLYLYRKHPMGYSHISAHPEHVEAHRPSTFFHFAVSPFFFFYAHTILMYASIHSIFNLHLLADIQ